VFTKHSLQYIDYLQVLQHHYPPLDIRVSNIDTKYCNCCTKYIAEEPTKSDEFREFENKKSIKLLEYNLKTLE